MTSGEIILLFGIALVGIIFVTFALFWAFGKNLTTNTWLRLTPGLAVLIVDVYILARVGGDL